jgi:hypothetical protein
MPWLILREEGAIANQATLPRLIGAGSFSCLDDGILQQGSVFFGVPLTRPLPAAGGFLLSHYFAGLF